MNQNYTSNGLNNPTYIPNQSTYPPYMNIPGYSNLNSNNSSNNNGTNTQINPQYAENLFSRNPGKKVTAYFSYPVSASRSAVRFPLLSARFSGNRKSNLLQISYIRHFSSHKDRKNQREG